MLVGDYTSICRRRVGACDCPECQKRQKGGERVARTRSSGDSFDDLVKELVAATTSRGNDEYFGERLRRKL